jgi:hypothetical protein
MDPLFSHPVQAEPVLSSDEDRPSAAVENPEFSDR